MAMEVSGLSSDALAVQRRIATHALPPLPGLPLFLRPAQDQPGPHHLAQGVPGPPGAPGQRLQLPSALPLPLAAQLPCAHGQEAASTKDGAAMGDTMASARPHLPAPALLATTKPRAVTTPAALVQPVQVSQQGPAALAEAFPQQAADTSFTHRLQPSFDTMHRHGTIPAVPDWDGFIQQFPELSDLTITEFFNEFFDFLERVVNGDCALDQALLAQLPDIEDGTVTADEPSCSAEMPHELPENCRAEDSSTIETEDADTTFRGAAESSQKDPLAAPMKNLLLSPRWQPRVLLNRVPLRSVLARAALLHHAPITHRLVQQALNSQPRVLLKRLPVPSPQAISSANPQHQPPITDRLVQEALHSQPRVVLSHLPLPLGLLSCQGLPTVAGVASRPAKRPMTASTTDQQESSQQDSIPAKKRRKMELCRLSKH